MHKLLLADDSVTIQRVIELTFSGEDVQVVAVNDGEQAIARIPLERPDVVLADIGMPRKGGYDVSAFVKGRADLSHIPVLLLAGAFEPVDQARAEQVKADGVLIKPFEPRQVIERVKELLSIVPQAPAPPEPEPIAAVAPPLPEPEPLPAVEAPPPVDALAAQSLDELFESLNQALNEPVRAVPAPAAVPDPDPAPAPRPEPLAESAAVAVHAAPEPIVERAERPGEEPVLEAVPEPEPFILEPPIAFEPLMAPGSNGSSLDDYFDRLSAAFEHASGPSSRLFQPMADRIEDVVPAARPQQWPADEWPAQEWLSPSGIAPVEQRGNDANPILEAVSALMAQATENGSAKPAPSAWTDATPATVPAPPVPSQAIVDAVTERVLARLAPEVAESLRRLVQQEIARTQR